MTLSPNFRSGDSASSQMNLNVPSGVMSSSRSGSDGLLMLMGFLVFLRFAKRRFDLLREGGATGSGVTFDLYGDRRIRGDEYLYRFQWKLLSFDSLLIACRQDERSRLSNSTASLDSPAVSPVLQRLERRSVDEVSSPVDRSRSPVRIPPSRSHR